MHKGNGGIGVLQNGLGPVDLFVMDCNDSCGVNTELSVVLTPVKES